MGDGHRQRRTARGRRNREADGRERGYIDGLGGGRGTAIFGNSEGDGFWTGRAVSHRWWIVGCGRAGCTAWEAPAIRYPSPGL